MKRHPLIQLVLDLLEDQECVDATSLAQFLGGPCQLPVEEEMKATEEAFIRVAQTVLHSMEHDGMIEHDEYGEYRLTTASK